jgi:phage RecT family recombinase
MTAPEQEQNPRVDSLADMLMSEKARAIIEASLPEGMSLRRVARAVAAAAHENPEMLKATGRSIVEAVAKGVRWNLELGRHWYIIPRKVKVKRDGEPDRYESRARAELDYKGKAILLKRLKLVRTIRAACVFENEFFKANLGTAENHSIEHGAILSEQHRGALVGAYGAAELERGRNFVILQTKAVIERNRQKNSEMWKSMPLEQVLWWAEKALIHQLWKWLEPDIPVYFRDDAKDESTTEDEVDGDEEAAAAIVPGSASEKHLLGAGPVATVHVSQHRDGVPATRTHVANRTPRTESVL